MFSIERVRPEQAKELSNIAVAAKAYWGYPKSWMVLWKPQLTFSPEFFEQYESWMAVEDTRPIGFYTLEERNGNAWLENLWVSPDYMGKGVGKALFLHAVELCVSASIRPCSSKPIQTQSVFTRSWECTRYVSDSMKSMDSRAFCLLWK